MGGLTLEISDSNSKNDDGPIYSTFHDESEMIAIVREYVKALPVRVQSMRDALRDKEIETLQTVAHGLHGSGGGFGFMIVSEISAKIEKIAGQGDEFDAIEGHLEDLSRVVERITCAYGE